MKPHYITLLVLLTFYSHSHAERFFSLFNEKEGRVYRSSLTELDGNNGEVLATVDLGQKNDNPIKKLALSSDEKLFFYHYIDKKNAQLQVVDQETLKVAKPLMIEPLNIELLESGHWYRFMHLSEDQSHLYLHTGSKKNQALTVIDVVNNKTEQRIPLSKYENRVRLSTDQKYLSVTDTKKKQIKIFSLDNQSIIWEAELNKRGLLGEIHQDHLYLTRFDGRHRDTRNSVADHMFGTSILNDYSNTNYWIEAINLNTGKATTFDLQSTYAPTYAINPDSDQLLTLSTIDKDKTQVLSLLNGDQITEFARYDVKLAPESMHVDDQFNRLLVLGGKDFAIINLSNKSEFIKIDRPFDVVDHFYDESGRRLYLKEGVGSEVAVVDTQSGDFLGRSGTGRPGVKVGQAIATGALALATGESGFGVIILIYSNTGFLLNQSQEKLYVINSKTSDVTRFNANDLSEREAIPTGRGTFLLYQSSTPEAPIWVFSGEQITQINDPDFKVEHSIEYEMLVGLDFDSDHFIITTDEHVKTIDMKSGETLKQWPVQQTDLIWYEKSPSKPEPSPQLQAFK